MPLVEGRKRGKVSVIKDVGSEEMWGSGHGACTKECALGLGIMDACGKVAGLVCKG